MDKKKRAPRKADKKLRDKRKRLPQPGPFCTCGTVIPCAVWGHS